MSSGESDKSPRVWTLVRVVTGHRCANERVIVWPTAATETNSVGGEDPSIPVATRPLLTIGRLRQSPRVLRRKGALRGNEY